MQFLSSDHLLNHNCTMCVCVCVFSHEKYNIEFQLRSFVEGRHVLNVVTLLNPVKMFSYFSHLGFYLFYCKKPKIGFI